jgi:hypothetical protein
MKHHFFKILMLSVVLSAIGCVEKLDVSSNERLLVKGTVVDQNGNPLQNISIKTGAVLKTLASTNSDASGHFEFTSLNANDKPLSVLVNIDYPIDLENGNPDYSSKVYSSGVANRNLLLDLGTVTLNGVGTFSLFLKNQPGDNNSLSYTLSYTSNICNLPINANGNDFCELDQTESNYFDQNSENRTINRESILGSFAVFEYSLNNEPTQTIEIPVTNPPTNYVFEY